MIDDPVDISNLREVTEGDKDLEITIFDALKLEYQQVKNYIADFKKDDVQKLQVLSVDDVSVNTLIIESHLKKYECVVDHADSGNQALEMLEYKQYNIVFWIV